MSKKKVSAAKKHFRRFRSVYVALGIEMLILLFFLPGILQGSDPISTLSLETVSFSVEDVRSIHWSRGSRVYVFSDTDKYIFSPGGSTGGYFNSDIPAILERGDQICITYYTTRGLFGSNHWIVDAYTQTHKLRTMEAFIRDVQVGAVIGIIIFIIVEITYIPGAFAYLWINGIFEPKKKRKKRKKRTQSLKPRFQSK